MVYSLQDIELMISDIPRYRTISSLDEYFTPQRRHIKAKAWHLPDFTRARKIINSMIECFENNPNELENDWTNSNIPYFLWDVQEFSEDQDVKRLMQIQNIENVINIQNSVTDIPKTGTVFH